MRFYTRKIKKYAKGETIFAENAPCDGMYIVDKGKVRVFKTTVVNGVRKEIELCELGPRAMFGEMSMIDEESRSASVQAIAPTECTVITKQIFEDQLTRIPPWMVNMIKILVRRLRDTNEKLRDHIENNTKPEDDDTGRLITVGGEPPAQTPATPDPAPQKKEAISPDEIIEDLFQ